MLTSLGMRTTPAAVTSKMRGPGGEEDRRLLQWLDQDALNLLGGQLRCGDGGRGHEGSRG
jgi:hypothetical protein